MISSARGQSTTPSPHAQPTGVPVTLPLLNAGFEAFVRAAAELHVQGDFECGHYILSALMRSSGAHHF